MSDIAPEPVPDPDPTAPPVDFVNVVNGTDITLAPDQTPIYREEV